MKRYFFLTLVLSFFVGLLLPQRVDASYNDQQPIEITSDALNVDQKNAQATFKGNVKAVHGIYTLEADRMVVHYPASKGKKKGAVSAKTSSQISSIDVEGHVIFQSKKNLSAKGQKGRYDLGKQLVELEGDVHVTQKDNMLQGEKLTYHLKTREVNLTGSNTSNSNRVKGVLIPQ